MMYELWVKVIQVPRGEAPYHIRENWLGVTLPVIRIGSDFEQFGLVSGQQQPGRPSYAVMDTTAVRILKQTAPEAAEWFESQPYFGHCELIFGRDECEEVTISD